MTLQTSPSIGIRSGVKGTVGVEVRELGDRTAILARSASTYRSGALARSDGESLAEAASIARDMQLPLVMDLASSGADVLEGIDALHGWGGAARAVASCSGAVPVVAIASGPVISGPALLLGLADFAVMSPSAVAFVSGPSMVREFTGVEVGLEELGGVGPHSLTSGLCALEDSDPEVVAGELLGFLPRHADEEPPMLDTTDSGGRLVPELRSLVPSRDASSYDVLKVLSLIVDDGVLLELRHRWAPQVVTAFGRVDRRPVGIVANQPQVLAGTLDIPASQKAARFVRFCDSFNLPILTFVDTPGFLPGKDLEWRGMIRHGAELAFAYAESSVPRICVIMRKAFGGAYIVMDSKGMGNDLCLAWPGAEVAVMGASGAVQILNRKIGDNERAAAEQSYSDRYLNPWRAAERGFVDAVVDPAETRSVIAHALGALHAKRETLGGRKHEVGPL
ncbi:MAG: acyl-CoA carboxylase subunit beta [Acidimicrobiales bacterium]